MNKRVLDKQLQLFYEQKRLKKQNKLSLIKNSCERIKIVYSLNVLNLQRKRNKQLFLELKKKNKLFLELKKLHVELDNNNTLFELMNMRNQLIKQNKQLIKENRIQFDLLKILVKQKKKNMFWLKKLKKIKVRLNSYQIVINTNG